MEDKNWEDGLKDLLQDYKPEGMQPDWEFFSNYLYVHEQVSEWEENEVFDDSIKESISGFEASPMIEGWERVESSLNLADRQFDENIRHKVNQFEPTYYPRYWPLLLQRLSGVAYLRAKLIAFKVIEAAAVVLFLFTAVKMGQMGKLPFETPLFDHAKETPAQKNLKVEMADHNTDNPARNESKAIVNSGVEGSASVEPINDLTGSGSEGTDFSLSYENPGEISFSHLNRDTGPLHPITFTDVIPVKTGKSPVISPSIDIAFAALPNSSPGDEHSGNGKSIFKKIQVANFLGTFLSPIRWSNDKSLPKLAYVKQRSKTFTEFGVVSQLDYNKLRMPEDRLYSAGRQIIFPQQGIPSSNMGGGFSFALAHPKWAFETGMIYSAKNFKPGREAIVGGVLNNGSVEFEAMRLQLVSVPLHYRYKFDHKGAFKAYGLAGFGLNIIAQSNIDVLIKYQFPTLSASEDPNKDPTYGPIIKETRRISEHIRDGAPFSTKSFFSVEAGAGIEYAVTEHKTLFLQSALQYQIPNLRFSNNNGKHIRSVSVQAGVRTPLGK